MSRIMKFYCNRCKKEFDPFDPSDVRNKCDTYIYRYKVMVEYDDFEDECDLCADCFEKLNKFMNLGGCNNEEY